MVITRNHLFFLDHMLKFDALQRDSGGAEKFISHHGANDSFDSPMILLHQIVQILDLPNFDIDTEFII